MPKKDGEVSSTSHDHVTEGKEDQGDALVSRAHGGHDKIANPSQCGPDDTLAVMRKERRELLVRRRLFEPLFLLRDHLCPVSAVLYTPDDYLITG